LSPQNTYASDMLVVIFMSHGRDGYVMSGDGQKIYITRTVRKYFSNEACPALEGKPKLFLVQGCRYDVNNVVT
jgi:hypothetical protein